MFPNYLQCLAILLPLLTFPFHTELFLSVKAEAHGKSSQHINEILNCRKQRLESKWLFLPILSRSSLTSNIWFFNNKKMMLLSNTMRLPIHINFWLWSASFQRSEIRQRNKTKKKSQNTNNNNKNTHIFAVRSGKAQKKWDFSHDAQKAIILPLLALVFTDCRGLWSRGSPSQAKRCFEAHSTWQPFLTSSLLRKHLH